MRNVRPYGKNIVAFRESATATIREAISDLISDYQDSGKMSEDFFKLKPRERLIVTEKLMNYIAPKMQATAIDVTQSATDSLTDRLIALTNSE